jgi:hypothetical protein
MKLKNWLTENINFRRNDVEVRENKSYGATMGAAGFGAGVIAGIIVIILQFAVSGHDAQEKWINIVFFATILILLSYLVFMLLPVFKAANSTIGNKIVSTLVALGCMIGMFIVGLYLTIFLFMIVAAIAICWLALKVWLSSNSSSSSNNYSTPREESGPKKYRLDDGTIVTEDSVGSGYHGDDYHSYEKNFDGTFTRTD